MDTPLPPKLVAMLQMVPEQAFAARMQHVFIASAQAIQKLGELDLQQYEDAAIDDSADLSTWEHVAPHVGSTIAAVNQLMAEMARQFPPEAPAFDEKQAQAARIIATAANELRMNVQAFGLRIRDPSVVGDRWTLLTELQSFRARFRDRIGLCVYDVAQLMEECRRQDVDPGFEEALNAALMLRGTTSDFRRLVRARIQKVSEAPGPDYSGQVGQLELELGAFRKTSAWKGMRAQDKRQFLEYRQKLDALKHPGVTKVELLGYLEPIGDFVDGFESVNSREILVQHDRERQAAIGVALERAVNTSSDEDALAAFNEALAEAQRIYGRSGDVDSFLRKQRRTPTTLANVRPELDQFLMLLAGLNLY